MCKINFGFKIPFVIVLIFKYENIVNSDSNYDIVLKLMVDDYCLIVDKERERKRERERANQARNN